MTDASRAERAAWLEADRRNRGAYLRAQAALLAMETAVQSTPSIVSGNDAEYGALPVRRRARWMRRLAQVAGLAAVAVLGAGMFLHPQRWPGLAQHEMKLQDGSVVTLDGDAQVRVDMGGPLRRITLLNGKATFHVAKDKARPFVVSSGQVFAQATGTAYSVSRVGEAGARVDVNEGSVLVWAGNERDQAVLLRAGGKLTLDPGAENGGTPLPAPEVAQISLDGEPIIEAVARFNRVNRTQIVIADPALGQVPIVGLFRADDPEQFARAAAAIARGKVVKRNDAFIIEAQ